MIKIIIIAVKIIACLVGIAVVGFGAVQAVYWLNLDNKFMYLLYLVCRKMSSRVKRDRKF